MESDGCTAVDEPAIINGGKPIFERAIPILNDAISHEFS
jgi:hypothetical protein